MFFCPLFWGYFPADSILAVHFLVCLNIWILSLCLVGFTCGNPLRFELKVGSSGDFAFSSVMCLGCYHPELLTVSLTGIPWLESCQYYSFKSIIYTSHPCLWILKYDFSTPLEPGPGKWSLCRCRQGKMRWHWGSMGSKSSDCVLVRGLHEDEGTQTHTENATQWQAETKVWGVYKPKVTSDCRQPPKAQKRGRGKRGSLLELSAGAWPCQHLDGYSSLQNCERIDLCCFKPLSLW